MLPEFKLTPFTEGELKSANQPTHIDLLIDSGNALHDQIGCGCNAFFPCSKCKEAMERWDALTESLVKAVGDLQEKLLDAKNNRTGVPVCHVRDLIDAIGIPDRNCSCHTGAAPCHDCTEWGGLRHIIEDMDLDNRKDPAPSHFQALLEVHERLLKENPYCYFEVGYTRTTGWMAWLCTNSLELDKNRKVLAKGQGDSVEAACKDAINSMES